jgi:hypothetical protein
MLKKPFYLPFVNETVAVVILILEHEKEFHQYQWENIVFLTRKNKKNQQNIMQRTFTITDVFRGFSFC